MKLFDEVKRRKELPISAGGPGSGRHPGGGMNPHTEELQQHIRNWDPKKEPFLGMLIGLTKSNAYASNPTFRDAVHHAMNKELESQTGVNVQKLVNR